MEGGAPVQTDSLKMPAYFRIKTKRNTWMYSPSVDFGSDYHLVKKRKTTEDATSIEAIGAKALQPMANDGRASSITVQAVESVRHGLGLETTIIDARGEVEVLSLPRV